MAPGRRPDGSGCVPGPINSKSDSARNLQGWGIENENKVVKTEYLIPFNLPVNLQLISTRER